MRYFERFVAATAALAIICLAYAGPARAAERSSAYQAALESINKADLQRHVDRLADDDMEGREAGTKGGRAAAEYIVREYRRLGLRGAGLDGGYVQPFRSGFQNVLAVVEGSDPKLGNQTIVVCAHYDHVGYGYFASLGPTGHVHPGADDNASGTAAVLELAEAMTYFADPPKRSIVFANWDGEEKGLFGSKHWAANPTIPFDRVAAVINLDMIGRLRGERMMVYGSRSGRGWRRLLCLLNGDVGLKLAFPWGIKANADHYPFFDRGLPVVMFHTGLHEDYHRPYDVAGKINSKGMARVTRLLFAAVHELADNAAAVPEFRPAAHHETAYHQRVAAQEVELPDRLGVGWIEGAASAGGVRVSSVAANSPARKAGLRAGDLIVRFAGRTISSDDDFYDAVRTAASPVAVVVQRPGAEKPLELTVRLSGRPLRWGITWRIDDAEPGMVVIAGVAANSPAWRAGLVVGDRVYRVGGKDFADEDAFVGLIGTLDAPLELLVEREGRLRIVTLRLDKLEPLKRAA
ncbi:MAG: M28 family peptidase [Pirellulales bacterium]|nr:M28 family peptidase [Pirellulales bacterium]